MVILSKSSGQTSNTLIQFVHLDAFCKKNKISFYSPSIIANLSKIYPNLYIKYKKYYAISLLLKHIINIIGSIFQFLNLGVSFKNIDESIITRNKMTSNLITFVRGFYFRDCNAVEEYKSYYQHLFQPNFKTEDLHKKYFESNSCHIALHIRRGDYKTYANGKYYYSNDVYIDKINQTIKQLSNISIKIIIFTNDNEICIDDFKENCSCQCIISNQNLYEDHYLMSKCNYIIGAPSTFSLWASFMGNVPLRYIYSKDDQIDINEFIVSNSLYTSKIIR